MVAAVEDRIAELETSLARKSREAEETAARALRDSVAAEEATRRIQKDLDEFDDFQDFRDFFSPRGGDWQDGHLCPHAGVVTSDLPRQST